MQNNLYVQMHLFYFCICSVCSPPRMLSCAKLHLLLRESTSTWAMWLDFSMATTTPWSSTPLRGNGTQQHHLVSTSHIQEAGGTSQEELAEVTLSSLVFSYSSLCLVHPLLHNRNTVCCKRSSLYVRHSSIFNIFFQFLLFYSRQDSDVGF